MIKGLLLPDIHTMATRATCPRCDDFTTILLDEDGNVPEHAACICDGPGGCGYAWMSNAPPRADLAIEVERMLAIADELPSDYWPSWLRYLAAVRMREARETAPCRWCEEPTTLRDRDSDNPWAIPWCLACMLERQTALAEVVETGRITGGGVAVDWTVTATRPGWRAIVESGANYSSSPFTEYAEALAHAKHGAQTLLNYLRREKSQRANKEHETQPVAQGLGDASRSADRRHVAAVFSRLRGSR